MNFGLLVVVLLAVLHLLQNELQVTVAAPFSCIDDSYAINECNLAMGEGFDVKQYNMSRMDQLWDGNIFTGYPLPDGTEDIYITIETDSTFNFSEFRVWFTTSIETIDDGAPEFEYYNIDTSSEIEISSSSYSQTRQNSNKTIGYGFDQDVYQTYFWDIQISFDNAKNNNRTNISLIEIDVLIPTPAPTSPSQSPSSFPTESPIDNPTKSPTVPPPTTSPTSLPTIIPTESPTYALYLEATPRNENDTQSNFTYSTNIYPLSERGQTYSTFTVPSSNNKTVPYCTTCILAWANIDVDIWVEGCDDYDFGTLNDDGNVVVPGSFWSCNGTWVVETTAS